MSERMIDTVRHTPNAQCTPLPWLIGHHRLIGRHPRACRFLTKRGSAWRPSGPSRWGRWGDIKGVETPEQSSQRWNSRKIDSSLLAHDAASVSHGKRLPLRGRIEHEKKMDERKGKRLHPPYIYRTRAMLLVCVILEYAFPRHRGKHPHRQVSFRNDHGITVS